METSTEGLTRGCTGLDTRESDRKVAAQATGNLQSRRKDRASQPLLCRAVRSKRRLTSEAAHQESGVGRPGDHGPAVTKWAQAERTFGFGKKEVPSPDCAFPSVNSNCSSVHPVRRKGTEVY